MDEYLPRPLRTAVERFVEVCRDLEAQGVEGLGVFTGQSDTQTSDASRVSTTDLP